MKSGRRKKIWFIATAALGMLMLGVLAFPLWFPWVLRPVGPHFGLQFGAYERVGYQRFALSEMALTNAGVTIEAKRVAAYVPTVWLWHRFVSRNATNYVQARDWRVTVDESGTRTARHTSVYTNYQLVVEVIEAVAWWVPRAEFINGMVDVEGEIIQLPQATWTNQVLHARVGLPSLRQSGTVHARIGQGASPPYDIRLVAEALELHSAIRVAENESGLLVQADGLWSSNRFEAQAQFGRAGQLPQTAEFNAGTFRVPAGRLGLGQFHDLQGALSLQWRTNEYGLTVAAGARPVDNHLPAVDFALRVTGDLQSALIETATLSMPWMKVELAQPTRMQFSPPYLTEAASVKYSGALAHQPWFPATGDFAGQATFRPGPGRFPTGTFEVSGSGIQISNVQSKRVELRGAFDWPWLELTQARVELADASVAVAEGKLDLARRIVHGGHVSLEGRIGREWLPAGVSYGSIKMSAKLDGSILDLTHSGSVAIGNLAVPQMRVTEVKADWRGQGLALEHAQLSADAASAALRLEGGGRLEPDRGTLMVRKLMLNENGTNGLALEQPFQVVCRRAGAHAWELGIQPFVLRGPQQSQVRLEAELGWPERGRATCSVRNLRSRFLGGFVDTPTNRWEVNALDFSAGWTNGPLQLQLELAGWLDILDGTSFTTVARIKGDANGLALEKMAVSRENELVATADGFLPVSFYPSHSNHVAHAQPEGRIGLNVVVQPQAFFWERLAEASGVRLQGPELEAYVTGTWKEPLGWVDLHAREVKFKGADRDVPPIENLALDLQVKPERVQLESLTFSVANQPVRVSGQVPLPADLWAKLPGTVREPDWQQATARLEIERAQLAAITPFLSKMLTPDGTLQADVTLRPGGLFDGQLKVEGVNTRPLESVGAVRSIEVGCEFKGRRVEVKSKASVGGQTIFGIGQGDLSKLSWSKGSALPPFQLRLTGSNIPLARRVEAIVRADLDLTVTNAVTQPPVVVGSVQLRNSFFMQDLLALTPGGTAAPLQRPPYFRFEQEPFADWRLNVTLTGQRFLKVRTPLFNGEVSANLQLRDTLKEPIVVGEVKIADGLVRLPFANLPVTQGYVTLSSANPYQPQLFVTAAARVFSYDVKMEVTGAADRPSIQFSSIPPLTSEQILIMLTAGELPRSDFSFSNQQRAETMALYLGKSVLTELGLMGEGNRLTIVSGETISEEGKPTYSVEYKLVDRWSVIGEYDRFNDYNLMLKWRVYRR